MGGRTQVARRLAQPVRPPDCCGVEDPVPARTGIDRRRVFDVARASAGENRAAGEHFETVNGRKRRAVVLPLASGICVAPSSPVTETVAADAGAAATAAAASATAVAAIRAFFLMCQLPLP